MTTTDSMTAAVVPADRSLLRLRSLIGVAVILGLLTLPTSHPVLLVALMAAWFGLLMLQWLFGPRFSTTVNFAATQLVPDCLLVALVVFMTGGIYSPFALLFGLIVVGSVVADDTMFSIGMTIVACASYLVSGYLGLHELLDVQATLHLLLQTSAIMLVGGVMGALVRRQQRLQLSTQAVQVRHRSLQKLYAHVLDGMREGILILDADMRIQDFNAAVLDLLSLPADIEGHLLGDALKDIPQLLVFLRDPGDRMFQCESRQGEHVLLIRMMPVQGDTNAAWMMTVVDISHVRDLERQLAEQEKMAALGQMASMLAHEIRNPLQTMAQAHDLMAHTNAVRRKEISGIVQEELQRLNRLVSDMLNFARPMQPNPEFHCAADILSAAVHQADPEGRMQVAWHTIMEDIRVDADHFRLVLDNLLSNALRASPEKGSVGIELTPLSQAGWSLRVADHGGGIAPGVRDRLFEPFATASSNGLGLGLATVWHVCKVNHWLIDVRNTGTGTLFEVRSGI